MSTGPSTGPSRRSPSVRDLTDADVLVEIARLERLFAACETHNEPVLDWQPWAESTGVPRDHLAYLRRLHGINQSNGTY